MDAVLGRTLPEVLCEVPALTRIRVPRVIPREGYGWSEFVSHRYCSGDAELASFYRGIGHWLGIMRLLGGTDLHAENVIACGPVPVVVDCETLFTPVHKAPASGFGIAPDRARELISMTVLRTGMLPSRGTALGWRGVDFSAAGSLAGEQPVVELPAIVAAGTDNARLGTKPTELAIGSSHPSPQPVLAEYWKHVLDGFAEATDALRSMDRAGTLAPLLGRFADCTVRVVLALYRAVPGAGADAVASGVAP